MLLKYKNKTFDTDDDYEMKLLQDVLNKLDDIDKNKKELAALFKEPNASTSRRGTA